MEGPMATNGMITIPTQTYSKNKLYGYSIGVIIVLILAIIGLIYLVGNLAGKGSKEKYGKGGGWGSMTYRLPI